MPYLVRPGINNVMWKLIHMQGTFIVNHYKQAVQLIKDLENDFANDKIALGCDDNDFEQLLTAENKYLTDLEKPDPVVEMKKRYVASLHQLARSQYVTTYYIPAYVISTNFLL